VVHLQDTIKYIFVAFFANKIVVASVSCHSTGLISVYTTFSYLDINYYIYFGWMFFV